MKSLEQINPDIKYKNILAHERKWANSVAMSIVKQRPISVWEVLIPILFIFSYAKSRGDRDLLSKNIFFTKELALRAALDIVKHHITRTEAMWPIEEKTRNLLSSVDTGIYSESIRQKQIQEIDLLIEHYCMLLQAEGKDYDSMVMNTYKTLDNYLNFLLKLKGIEKEVNLAAIQTLGAKGDPETAARIEEAMDRVRRASAERIFNKTP